MKNEFKPAKASEVKIGDVLIADHGFTCLPPVARRVVKADDDDNLYIDCADGQHALSGQLNDDGEYSGLTPVENLI